MTGSYELSAASPSSTSSRKMTPQNSSSSTIGISNKPRDLSSGSLLLQERLREKKAESIQVRKRQSRSLIRYDDEIRYTQSSPVGRKESMGYDKDSRRPSTSGSVGMAAKKGFGAKEMEETLDKLHKKNFDLKLDLHHTREKQEKLEARVTELEAQLSEQDETQEINDKLILELERRDQAVEEAVAMICRLENQVEELIRDRSIVRSFDAAHTPIQTESSQSLVQREICSSPPNGGYFSQIDRMPSFLSDESEGVEALRSVYQHNLRQTFSSDSLPMLDEEDLQGMNSPRLSVLSQSSFLSVYGTAQDDNHQSNTSESESQAAPSSDFQDEDTLTESRTEEPRGARKTTPLRRTRALPNERNAQYQSINNVLESPLQRLEKLQRSVSDHNETFNNNSNQLNVSDDRGLSVKRLPRRGLKSKPSELKRSNTDDYLIKRHELPPTPDTISTSTLDLHHKPSDDLETYGGRRNSQARGAATKNDRRRSTDETLDRSEAWESESQSFTETVVDSHRNNVDPWLRLGNSPTTRKNHTAVRVPDLFHFGNIEDSSDNDGKDPTTKNWTGTTRKQWDDKSTITSSPGSNLRARRASIANRPPADPLIAHPTNPKREERRIKFEKGTRFETPMRASSGPSHLQGSQVHNTPLSAESTKVHASRPSSTEPSIKDSMRNRFTSKIFKRSETLHDLQLKHATSGGKSRRGSFNEHTRFSSAEVDKIGDDRGLSIGRPKTANESRLPVAKRRGSAFGMDGADDEDDADVGGVKAWLGIGRRRASFGFGGR